MEEEIELQLVTLNIILNNLRKRPKEREYLKETLLKKLDSTRKCKDDIYKLLFV